MARRSRSRRTQRDRSRIASRLAVGNFSTLGRMPQRVTYRRRPPSSWIDRDAMGYGIGDLRRYYPDRRIRPAPTLVGTLARVRRDFRDLRFQFDVPARVMVCVRRKVRREVMFAIGRGGGGNTRRRRRNQESNVKC